MIKFLSDYTDYYYRNYSRYVLDYDMAVFFGKRVRLDVAPVCNAHMSLWYRDDKFIEFIREYRWTPQEKADYIFSLFPRITNMESDMGSMRKIIDALLFHSPEQVINLKNELGESFLQALRRVLDKERSCGMGHARLKLCISLSSQRRRRIRLDQPGLPEDYDG